MGTITKIKGNEPQTVAEWVDFIAEPWWDKEVLGIVETGKRLIMAKEKAEHGKWLKILESKTLFGERTAQCLMSIARHPVLSNPHMCAVLPRAWRTLYELSRIPENFLLEYIQDGKVHPELTTREALDLKGHEERIEAQRQIIIGGCYQALSHCPCDCGDLKGRVTQEVIDAMNKVIDNFTSKRNELLALGMEKKEEM